MQVVDLVRTGGTKDAALAEPSIVRDFCIAGKMQWGSGGTEEQMGDTTAANNEK